ncbi:MAG TPA: DUF490 domain-containing protein, partial [Pasteurellaceae bacterium]|nr:DUF490 domain-containing protein [Pasteurellaceae bacterium]
MTDQTDNIATTESAVKKEAVRPKKKICRRVLCVISAVIFLPIFIFVSMLATESGTRVLVQWTDKLSDNLSIGEVSGSLQQGLVLKNVLFQSPGVNVHVEQARLRLDAGCLWQALICVEDMSVEQPAVKIDTAQLPPAKEQAEESDERMPMRRINLPIGVEVKKIAVENLSLEIDRNRMTLAQFQSALSLNNENGLILSPTQINDFIFVMSTTMEERLKQVNAAQEQTEVLDWERLEQNLTPPLLGNVQQIELPFDIHVQDIQGTNWQYQSIVDEQVEQHINVSAFRLQAEASNYTAKLQKFSIESSLGNVEGEGQIQLNQDFPLNFTFYTDFHPLEQDKQIIVPQSTVLLSLSGSLKKQTEISLKTQGAVDALLAGQVELNREKMPLQLTLTGSNIIYPFADKQKKGTDPLKVDDFQLKIGGNLLAYQIDLNAQAEGMGAPKTKLDLNVSGGLSHANIDKLQLNALDGTLNLQGYLSWKEGVAWQSELNLNKINAGAYLQKWPVVLSGKLVSSGYANSKDWQVNVPELNIQGNLSQRPLDLKADLTASQDNLLDVRQLLLTYGENKISAQGHISEQSDFHLDIHAPDLRGLWPELSASLVGKVDLTGKVTEPNIKLELTGNRIQFQDFQLNKLYSKANINVIEQIQGRADVELSDFSYGDIKVARADLWVTGNEGNHQLHLRTKGEPVAAVFNLYGNFDRTSQVWQGVLNQIDIQSPVGAWNNDKNINVSYDNKLLQATVSAHCWSNPNIDLCFPQSFKAGTTGEVPFALRKFNLEMVNKLTEQSGLLKGQLRSEGKVAWFTDKPLQLNIRVDGDNLALAKKIDYRTFNLTVPRLSVNAQLENNNLALKSEVRIQNQGQITTDLKLQDIAKARKLSGTLNIQQLNLNLARQLLSNSENVNGDVNASLTFSGDLSAPLLNGSFNIDKIRARMKSLPFDLTDGKVSLAFHGNRSTLEGYLNTPESSLQLDGDAAWQSLERWNTRVHVKTDQFYVDIPSLAKLKITTDVTAKATPTLLDLSGEVAVPWARITVEELSASAVSVSGDEVILDNKTDRNSTALPTNTAAQTKSDMAIRSDLKIRIGNDVLIDAYGLRSHLEGLLAVKQEKGNLGLYGQIELKNGRYASFGQDLLIRKGQIGFSGLPSQPVLNIEAIRNPEAMESNNIIAGIKVIGAADSPKVEVFSEPSMPQDQALSYILTGRSLENSGETGSSGSVGAALLSLGLGKSGKLVGGIGEAFGIQDLSLGTAGVGDSSKVVVSGNITPRLQIKYGVGLFDGLAEVT